MMNLKFEVLQKSIINCILFSKSTKEYQIMMLSYLFFQLCWDFDYYGIIASLEGDKKYEFT